MAWRRAQLKRGGRGVDLDWLLDLGGGLSWRDLQLLMVDAERTVILESPLETLEEHWLRHLQHHVPCSIWWVSAPGVMWSSRFRRPL